ncbi:50S ribosomal protein L6 [Desulfovibrio sulfodismutans]|uniref:Large ribosomal subunit protein uL6 n=1 Tax=Desulfolutivibrio sulfodismutans TaxID=63561 RepID=A0A7K3NQW1_9BACT|nr:50S ribosomal protein L6 [Desulfolutivibrio sulfodismutans]NDY58185.1 50S ribosomal protein L6 [Desulfolutivibrio sulfodismutans]QLA12029.1 50S ribosomal protein L6 [Desulfolutivibrio sulfodismutans DSM 3696]
MSRIGKKEIILPSGVSVAVEEGAVTVKGPKGELSTPTHPKVAYAIAGSTVSVNRLDDTRVARAQHGLRRTLLANLVEGVSKGFSKTLEVIGVGYKVSTQGGTVSLSVGFSHQVEFKLPQGIEAKVEGNKLTLAGIDKQLVGETAARIRRVRPPEPFKGKGIKYETETIRRKAGKSGGKK